jgi:ribonuclease P protein component
LTEGLYYQEDAQKEENVLQLAMNLQKTPKILSLKDKNEILTILKNGYIYKTEFGKIVVNNDCTSKDLKFAIFVSKNCGSAVRRNYLKRVVRNILNENITLFLNKNRVIFFISRDMNYKYKNIIYNIHKVLNEKISINFNKNLPKNNFSSFCTFM